jgi:hypothetical protein
MELQRAPDQFSASAPLPGSALPAKTAPVRIGLSDGEGVSATAVSPAAPKGPVRMSFND